MTLERFWEWFDKRDIDKHLASMAILYGTVRITEWAMLFASAHAERPGLELAAIIAAVTAPITYLQTAVFKAYISAKDEK